MPTPEENLAALGLSLPAPAQLPEGMVLPFRFINIRGTRALISGHPKQGPDGMIAGPYGTLGKDISTEDGHAAARDIALSVLSNLKAEIGELSRVTGWVRVFGMVASTPDYNEQHMVVDGFSEVILAAFGADVGAHSRSAVGMVSLPLGFAMEIEGECLIEA